MKKFIVLIPVYNDWKSVSKLLKKIDLHIVDWESKVSVLIVNDASTETKSIMDSNLEKIKSVKVLNMKKNQGHARCFATGLKFIIEREEFDHVILMDADGEDRPEELSLLFNKSKEHPEKVITADRVKRSEGLLFKFCYLIHKYLTYIFTGRLIKFGNYACLPREAVVKMIEEPSTWSSFAGSLAKLFLERISVPTIRSVRYYGPSKMSFFRLLIHSFSIIATFKRTVFLRSFIFLSVYLLLIFQFLSFITLLPVFLIIILLFAIIWVSNRENLDQLKKSLDNISSIDNFN
jgi:glycosyltransferase involved in cell wall biosynthesis